MNESRTSQPLRSPMALLAALAMVAATCVASSAIEPAAQAAAESARELRPPPSDAVDCLLPSQIRTFGSGLRQLAPRRQIRTSALRCAQQGGEIVGE